MSCLAAVDTRHDLGVLGLDHLTQPGVGRAERPGFTLGRPDIRHEPYLIIAGAQ